MLFSNRYKFLFVHIAKTAGTSIQSALKRLRRRDPLSYPQVLCYNFSKIFRHRIGSKIPRHARVVAAYDVMPREQFEELFKFTFIRNPWDIQVSAFYHLKREWPDVMSENGCVEFGDYLRWSLNPDRPYHRAVDPLNQNMIDYMINMDGSMLMDYVGCFERLKDDWAEICSRIGVPTLELPRKRVSESRADYREYYDEELSELVENHYRSDIEAFGYSFDSRLPSGSLQGEVSANFRRSVSSDLVTEL